MLQVFVDTSVLLKAFAYWRIRKCIPSYLSDTEVRRVTAEKCVFEAYMAFRGIGGKKPDEGRQDWAHRHLKAEHDPKPLDYLISKYHMGNSYLAHYWMNQIEEANASFGSHGRDNDLDELITQHDQYEALCGEFRSFLVILGITVVPYMTTFAHAAPDKEMVPPTELDRFVRSTTIPSEDFEILYAALRAKVDVFLTEDARLQTCSASLGLNYPLSPAAFVSVSGYADRVLELRME